MLSYEVLYITSILDFIHTIKNFIHGPSKNKFLAPLLYIYITSCLNFDIPNPHIID